MDRYIDFYLSTCASRRRVLPLALKHLSAEDWKELDMAFLASRDPLTGHEPNDLYRPLFTRSCRKRRRRSGSARAEPNSRLAAD